MSNVAVAPKRHRASRGAAMPATLPSSLNSPSPHLLNMQAHAQNSQVDISYTPQPSTPPKTPRRTDQSQQTSHNISSSAATESGSKQRNRNKNRPKNVMTSPAATRNDRNTPPLTGSNTTGVPTATRPISTPSTAAYAGPTFHASPAPSALPIPSFYSKSVPDSPDVKGLKSLKTTSPSTLNLPSASIVQTTSDQLQREESPLDFFFKADREEKARARSASSTLNSAPATGPFPPPPESPHNTPSPTPTSQDRARNRISSSAMFAMEMDSPSSPGAPYGPAFSTPYAERINAARSSTTPTRPRTNSSQNPQQSAERTEALKAYLFSGRPLQSPASPSSFSGPSGAGASPRSHNLSSHDGKSTRKSGRSSGLRQEVTPTRTPTKTPDRNSSYANSPTPSRTFGHSTIPTSNDFMGNLNSHTNSPTAPSPFGVKSAEKGTSDLRGMEDTLRKILKLEPASSSGVTGSGIGVIAGASVPNYVGGRQPPMNGMHNGVMGS